MITTLVFYIALAVQDIVGKRYWQHSPSVRLEQRRTDDWNAARCEIANHLTAIKIGHAYRCMWCGKESLAVKWIDLHICPICHREEDQDLLALWEIDDSE